MLWQDGLEATIPAVPYLEMNFTMPKIFWPIFQQNRHLLNDLPSVGAAAIEFWVQATHGVRVILMIVQQTYGGFLNFYPHLHCLVSAGGLDEYRCEWKARLTYGKKQHKHELMLAWRYALLGYLHAAACNGVLKSGVNNDKVIGILEAEAKRDWNIFVGSYVSKRNVVDHIGRYIRRAPIAQYRLTRVNDHEVEYQAKDTRNRCLAPVRYTNEEFISPLVRRTYARCYRRSGLPPRICYSEPGDESSLPPEQA